ncbi:phosphoribosylformylglycinamidine synthase subunit PurS [Aliarcobacter thereius]|uniref:Phosphoribosylformylglycinamidine synthase subunit PurS n=2 Tax=Aliarcobacter thereius TaxID=544718 RepID=A0A1C0B8H1_9BACT|nr:phosphoribosylformylglycinamidine synthase subunit PurS [Aliarcobacter thereius]OCL87558.1 phosphoribosylformylglycinamidine synthase subunit PurS [Aliarcobacter thereius]OCL93799.1 phosphoribosylformylglycinamidine synthase subunit PurS [Aliarcobacter thereius]OCL95207.1 phosphoribosylformylglycinamidine synthase subunit PurS [Aliarcobacter thereius LMG 24486]OCL99899.1 phosphoribosylformylglycinamidine synthase subunit PurS [Aliarcobacter thereius]QBF16803.1 phosphoribosylformylglycinamid
MRAIVNIGLKKGVLDDQGKAINNALGTLGFKDLINDVRVGKQIIIELNTNDKSKAEAEVAQMCEKLLANTVIEDYSIEIVG